MRDNSFKPDESKGEAGQVSVCGCVGSRALLSVLAGRVEQPGAPSADNARKKRSSASSEVQQVSPTLIASSRTILPSRARMPRVVHRHTVEGLTDLPPRREGSRLAASAKERSVSVKALMAMAKFLAIEIAELRSPYEQSDKNGPTDANCTKRRSATDAVYPRHFRTMPSI
jgi:hypothetical protein